MSRTAEELHIAYIGGRLYAAAHRLRAATLIPSASTVPLGPLARGGEDEVSEEIVVYGESSDPGGGGTDVITLDPWMYEMHIIVKIPPRTLPDPGPPGGDTPADPCTDLTNSLNSLKLSLAADETALEALDELIDAAGSPQERKALREEKRQTKDDIEETTAAISNIESEMATLGC